MSANRSTALLSSLHGLVRPRNEDAAADTELLNRFFLDRDEAAFATLVHRYGPLVLGVCKRLLRNLQDAEDAFQATFLVVLLKARPIANPELLANWLYGVAYHTAQNARTSALRRQARERAKAEIYPPTQVALDDDFWEWKSILDEELNRLPEKYREPVILCGLRGMSRKEAARRLRCPEGTLSSRLARAHERLQTRLVKRGLVLSVGAVGGPL